MAEIIEIVKCKSNKVLKSGLLFVLSLSLLSTFILLTSCDDFPADVKGRVTSNVAPIVEFANVPADGDTFSYAPVIHWKGRDADGFVEHYMYADIIDSTALNDPEYYIDFIPEEAWVQTETTSDTVYLLTETGQITQHIFYLKCVDDREEESETIYRRFYRSNQPPNVPEIKWWADPDEMFHNDIPSGSVEDTASALFDTLFCLDEITETWGGLGFTWRSSDPDDRSLYKIPLEFRYYLEKVPHDTVWAMVSSDWSGEQEIQFAGLETGHYVFSVWVRDDGFETSSRPATATFDVYEPTFEQSILLLNTTDEEPSRTRFQWNVVPGNPIGELYRELTSMFPDVEYVLYSGADGLQLDKSYLGRFRLVIWFSENQATAVPTSHLPVFEERLRDYVRVGGRLWVLGLMTRTNMISNTTLGLAESTFGAGAVSIPQDEAEFVGAISGVSDLPDLSVDTLITGHIFREYFMRNENLAYGVYPLLPGVDIITAGNDVETVYYFNSYTDTASGDVWNELAEVRANVGEDADAIYYPPTPVDCIIAMQRNRILEVTKVINLTKTQMTGDTVRGEVQTLTNNIRVGSKDVAIARISHPYGEPWALSDSIMVDYLFQPYSESHLRPCAVRYELLSQLESGGMEVRYRVAVFTFPLYYLDNNQGQVTEMFHSMLNWFFLPFAH